MSSFDSELGLALLVAACGVAIWCARRASLGSPEDPVRTRSWCEIHLPVWVAIVASALTIASDPVLGAAVHGHSSEPNHSYIFLWPIVGIPVLAGAIGTGWALVRRDLETVALRQAWLWPALAGLTSLLVLANRLEFPEGQLLMLGAVSILWWRSVELQRRGPRRVQGQARRAGLVQILYGSALLGAAGALLCAHSSFAIALVGFAVALGAAVVLVAILPASSLWVSGIPLIWGIGASAVVRVAGVAAGEGFRAVERGDAGAFEVALESLASTPYLSGIGAYAIEAALLLITAAIVAAICLVRPTRRTREIAGFVLLVASVVTIVSRALMG